jgi:iron complex outermembrane receptor protein
MSSDTSTNMLKYRFNHLAKADIELNYKKYSLGFSMRYNSFMRNIDRVFLEDLNPTADELFVLPGLSDYRQRFNGGNLVFDARIGYTLLDKIKLNFIVNNLFNAEYTSRPADIQPPRTFMLQLQFRL